MQDSTGKNGHPKDYGISLVCHTRQSKLANKFSGASVEYTRQYQTDIKKAKHLPHSIKFLISKIILQLHLLPEHLILQIQYQHHSQMKFHTFHLYQ